MDIENLLRLLNGHKVRYVIIGAAAFPVYGYARATLDVDIFIETSETNIKKCLTALKKFGYDVSDVSIHDLQKKKVLIRQYITEVDIHPFVKGVLFEQVWKNRVRAKIDKVTANFASLDDLVRMKKAAGRPKDKEDLRILKKLQKRRKSK